MNLILNKFETGKHCILLFTTSVWVINDPIKNHDRIEFPYIYKVLMLMHMNFSVAC